jgi:hypothetical protein
MNSEDLCQKLDTDFRLSECRDEWQGYGGVRFVAPQFHARFMGVFLDHASEITRVYTAVFPSPPGGLRLALVHFANAMTNPRKSRDPLRRCPDHAGLLPPRPPAV